MEELNNLEQPNIVSEDSHADESGVDCGQSLDTVLGSNSKFKSVDALNTAYNNLQAEFTKKCQHLRELEKSIEEKSTPRYKLDSWSEELSDFFENNPKATQYSKEIAKMILENEDLAKKSDCLKLAWANILSEKFVEQSDLASNQEFLEKYIYSNENIKDEIIKKHMLSIGKSPTVISGSNGAFSMTPKSKPRSMEDAKYLISELFR